MNPLRVMIVEDDAGIAGLLAETLEAYGHSVCAIETSEAGAVAAAARERPELIIIDVMLAPGSGVHALATIGALAETGPVPHVLISGDRPVRNPEILLKPFRISELLQAMERALAVAAAGEAPGLREPALGSFRS